jgi:phosphoenolpyruvate-protein phosphotransferase
MERALHGVSASPGVVAGRAIVLDGAGVAALKIPLAERAVEASRAAEALRLASSELEEIAKDLRQDGRDDEADIVETGVLMALDPGLNARVETLVVDSGLPAAEALREAAERTAAELSELSDPRLALRADDVRSVGRRAAARASGKTRVVGQGVLVARTLGPADVAELAPNAKGIALAGGGVTAHAAIVARSLGLPMVVGLGQELLAVKDGEEIVIDGDRGMLVRGPDPERITLARLDADRRSEARAVAVTRRLEPAVSSDGHRVRVLANVSTLAELREAAEQGAEGVGLLRSELLFLEASGWPSLEQQVNVLRPVLGHLSGRTATVRLFDFGGDKTPPFLRGITLRGIDVLLAAPDELKTQLAAILRSGAASDLRILVPMVTSPTQMHVVRASLEGVLEGRRPPQLGAMIETPEAAVGAAEIAKVADFMSLGTNDLTQLVLGLDREQSKTASVTDLRVLHLIAGTMRAARAAQILVDVCGEAASDPEAMPIMVGLGVDELSVAAARVGQVRQWVREIDFAAVKKGSEKLLHQARHARRERV